MKEKTGSFFERFVDRIVLAVVGAVCLWLLITRVLISPNYVEYNNMSFAPGAVDSYILGQTHDLEARLAAEADPLPPPPATADAGRILEGPLGGFDAAACALLPDYMILDLGIERDYPLPEIGKIEDAAASHLRSVAYLPVSVVDEENPYDQLTCEPNDLDLVTVEGQIDAAGIYGRFLDSFAGQDIPPEWRDPCLAVPVFAAVELQRQRLLEDGSWGEWQRVRRPGIDSRRDVFEAVADSRRMTPGEVRMRLLQFGDWQMQRDLLQPESYRIASADQEWFPPSLEKEFLDIQRQMELKAKRAAMEAEKRERERERTRFRGRTPGGMGRTGELGGEEEMFGSRSRRRPDARRQPPDAQNRRGQPQSQRLSVNDVYTKFQQCLVDSLTEYSQLTEPLPFWALDDTVVPGQTYRYMIRAGVFNPVAGTGQVRDEDGDRADDAVLWSEFSDVTEPLSIPEKLYFFPVGVQEASGTVNVQVFRYVLGYWYSRNFMVWPGEVMGRFEEYEPPETDEGQDLTVPKSIDYSTGAVFLGLMPVTDWVGTRVLRDRHYFDMLYCFDASTMMHRPIQSRYWDDELRVAFNEVSRLEKAEKLPLRPWGSKHGARKAKVEDEEFDEYDEEESPWFSE
jgi:hypothetical protein